MDFVTGDRRMNSGRRQNYRGDEAVLTWRAEAGAARTYEHTASREAKKQGIAAWVTREVAAAWAACGAFERVAFGYLAASSALIGVFAENLAHPMKLFAVQVMSAAVILILCG